MSAKRTPNRKNRKNDRTIADPPTGAAACLARRRIMRASLILLIGLPLVALSHRWLQIIRSAAPDQVPASPDSLEQLDPEVKALVKHHLRQVAASPKDGNRLCELGLVYEANELWAKAHEAFEYALRLNPLNRNWRLHRAITAHELGQLENELAEIQQLASAHPDFAPVQQRWGRACLESNMLDDAARAFKSVILHAPNSPEGYVGLADVRLRHGQAQAAVTLLQEALKRDGRHRIAHFLLGNAYRKLGLTDDAKRHLELGVGGKPRNLMDSLAKRGQKYQVNRFAREKQAMSLLVSGRVQQAAKSLEQILKDDPDNVNVMNNLATAYAQMNRRDEAFELLQRALMTDEKKHTTYVNLANWSAMHGQYAKALEYADAAIKRGPRVDLAHRARASVLFHLHRYDEALASAKMAAVLNPSDARIQEQCADLAIRSRRVDDAVEHYHAAISIDPRRAESWIGLARIYLAAGRIQDAQQAIAEAQRLAPQNPIVRRLSAEVQKLQ